MPSKQHALLIAHFPGIVVCRCRFRCDSRRAMMTCVTTVRCCGTSGRYQLTCHVVSANRDMMLRWWVLVGLLWLATWHCAIVFVWLVCRQWQLGRALSVETRYGGVCDLLVALATCSLPQHHCSLLLLLWTATAACGVVFVEAGVISVCWGGCAW